MTGYIDDYWLGRLERTKRNLEKNGFEVHLADSAAEAARQATEVILPAVKTAEGRFVISFGGSMSVAACGLHDSLKTRDDLTVIDTTDYTLAREEMVARRRRALTCDLFITGTNALVEDGRLVNLGNRVAALAFGPTHVLLIIGRNKLASSLDEAMRRIKDVAAPINAARLNRKTPCVKTRQCEDCASPDRICSVWTITEKSMPKGRVKIILVNAELGF